MQLYSSLSTHSVEKATKAEATAVAEEKKEFRVAATKPRPDQRWSHRTNASNGDSMYNFLYASTYVNVILFPIHDTFEPVVEQLRLKKRAFITHTHSGDGGGIMGNGKRTSVCVCASVGRVLFARPFSHHVQNEFAKINLICGCACKREIGLSACDLREPSLLPFIFYHACTQRFQVYLYI